MDCKLLQKEDEGNLKVLFANPNLELRLGGKGNASRLYRSAKGETVEDLRSILGSMLDKENQHGPQDDGMLQIKARRLVN